MGYTIVHLEILNIVVALKFGPIIGPTKESRFGVITRQ